MSSAEPSTTTQHRTTSKVLTSTNVITSNTFTTIIAPHSNATTTVTTLSTTPQCVAEDCNCAMGICVYNKTLGRCNCQCQTFVFGDICSFGVNDTSANVDTGAIPTQKANFTLSIQMNFQPAFKNLSSDLSQQFINTLKPQLEALCREADPQNFERVKIINLLNGSVVANSVAEYSYPNNETQIQYINTQLETVLTGILNGTNNLHNISQAFNNSAVTLKGVTFQSPEIINITDLKPYINCSNFANYTAEIIDGQWQCVGPCKTNPDYCHQHGECFNQIYKGPICRCYESSLHQFYGPQCDLFRWGPGFYGALFGSLAAALLILIIIVIAVIFKKKYTGVWKRKDSFTRRLSAFEEDFFDFSGNHNLGSAGTYSSEGFRPHLENVAANAGHHTTSRGLKHQP